MEAGSVTSRRRMSRRPAGAVAVAVEVASASVLASDSALRAARASRLRAVAITWWPRRGRWRAVKRPMPAVAPVMRMVLAVVMVGLLVRGVVFVVGLVK